MFRRLQPKIGFGWTVRAIGFVSLGTLAVSLVILGQHKKPKSATKKPLFDLRAFAEIPFLGFALSLLLIFLAFYIPLFYIPSYAAYKLHINEDFSFYLLAITNAGSFFGRTVPFLIANRVGSIQTFFFWAIAAVIVLFSWLGIHNTPGFVVFCVIWGFISGVLVTAPAAAVAHPTLSPSMSVIGTRLGMSWITAAIGILIGSPIAGALVDLKTNDFLKAIVFSGSVMAGGVLCLIPPVLAVVRYKAPEH
jgi:predicted MFS family arabinose efflux permease